MIAIAAPDVRNLVRAVPEPFAQNLVLPLPGLPDGFGAIGRFECSLYGFVFRFARYVTHASPQLATTFDARLIISLRQPRQSRLKLSRVERLLVDDHVGRRLRRRVTAATHLF